jgi:DNA polymerase-3 subunit epsilon
MKTTFVILDTETTGLEKEDRLVEIGAVVFSANLGIPLTCHSMLIEGESNPASHINRIPDAAIQDPAYTVSRSMAMDALSELMGGGPGNDLYVLAHNAEFDRPFLHELKNSRWICTKEDASWPRVQKDGPRLVDLALAYDVGIVRAHRAIEDCLTLAAVLTRVHELEHGLGAWLARALEEKKEVRANVGYKDNAKAKAVGFRWDPERKIWWKRIRVSELAAARDGFNFNTEVT